MSMRRTWPVSATRDGRPSAVAFDYDLDGDLDLFAAQYVRFVLGEQPWCGREDMGLRFYCDPRVFEPTADILYRNEGHGVFSEVSRQAGIAGEGNGLGAVAGDFDGDGDPTCTWPTT